MTYHCVCKEIYDPVDDIQHYCDDCGTWYHSKCCKSIARAVPRPQDMKDKIYRMPIMRGVLGSLNNEWRISGNGWHSMELVRGSHKKKKFPDNWEDQLSDDFMTIMEHASFTYCTVSTVGSQFWKIYTPRWPINFKTNIEKYFFFNVTCYVPNLWSKQYSTMTAPPVATVPFDKYSLFLFTFVVCMCQSLQCKMILILFWETEAGLWLSDVERSRETLRDPARLWD